MTLTPALPVFSRVAMRRHAVRSGCAMALALALAANPGMVSAQSFLGVPLGEGVAIVNGTGTTDITVFAPQAVINWTLPSSPGTSPEVFQPVGTTANFVSGTSGDFTVLNRILPMDGATGPAVNRPAQFNGTVTGPPNSSIWFYSPAGIVIGAGAAFNVGNLVLTSNDIDTTGGFYGPNGEIRFRGPASSLAPVEIQAGAVINAGLGQGNYLAIVAPRIVQAGTISANGHVALVAAEQADITINAGLLDIMVTQGTTDPNGIIHTGSTGGPASTASDDRQVLSLIAMPKNTALTMLLSGSIGYTPAASALDEGSAVVLSAGDAGLGQNFGNISIGNAQFTSAVMAVATNAIDIAPTGGTVRFQQGGSLTAFQSITAIAGVGETILSDQPLSLRSSQGTTGGSIILRAEGGDIAVTGGLTISADSEFPFSETDQGANATGGIVTVSVSGGGNITAASLSATANGQGGNGFQSGGNGVGGTISLLDQGGTLDLGQVTLAANGIAGRADGQIGNATSGSILIDITTGTKNWSALSVEANAGDSGGFLSGVAGNATGRADAIRLHVGSGATLNIDDNANLSADAYADINGAGNTGTGGGISVLVDGGGTLRVSNTLNISAGAAVPPEAAYYSPQTGPTLIGGTVNVLADGGTIEVNTLLANANASGTGTAEVAGSVTGGTAIVGAANGGTIRTFAGANSNPGSLSIEANAYGSTGVAPANATGGTATLFASDGTLDIDGDVLISASALSNPFNSELSSGTGFTARGGTASLELRAGTAGTASLNAGGMSIFADGNADYTGDLVGDGGTGIGGTARFSVAAGAFTLGETTIRADGEGVGGMGETGGIGIGGTAAFLLNDSGAGITPRSMAALSLTARGAAGRSNTGLAGYAASGQTQLTVNAGSPTGAVTVFGDFNALAVGGRAPPGIDTSGNGFVANIGSAAFNVVGSAGIITNRDVSMTITAGGAFATQDALYISTPRSLTTTGLVSAAGDVIIFSDMGISMSDLRSGGTTRLSSLGGPIRVSNDLSSAGLVTLIGTAVNIRSLGALSLGDIGAQGPSEVNPVAGDFAIEVGGDLLTGTLAVTGNVSLTSGGTLRVGGRIVGTNITAASGDIVIGPNGSIGERGITQSITLFNTNPASLTFIGGTTQQGGYSLDAAETTRLFADNSISLGLPMGAAPNAADLVIGDLALSYGASGNIGTGGILKINAPGRIRVNGQVALTTSSSADRFSIDPTRIEIDTDTGGITMQDANGGLLGQLELVGGTIAVASGATLAAIANLSNPMDINAALDAAPANPNDAGYLRAGSITLNATDAIYIANTGASTENPARRGFTANSLSIITASPATHVSINGVLVDSSGAAIAGQDTLSLVTVNGAPATVRGLFSRFSTVNGCVMGAQSCNAPLTAEMVKTKSDIEVPLDPEGSKPQFTYVLEIDEREPDDQQPLVDEPVTGVGNDDLWNGACGSNPSACPQGGNSQ